MRKIYVLRLEEHDGRALEAMKASGVDPDNLENPRCPVCGSETLVAYAEEGEYDVLTWYCLTEENEPEAPEAWYLICLKFPCEYEERVERAADPRAADILFDLYQSHSALDEYSGLIDRCPSEQKELIGYLEHLKQVSGHRKLDAYLHEAQWRYRYELKQNRKWVSKIPSGRRIWFHVDGEEVKATFVMSTDDTMLVRLQPSGELVGFPIEALNGYGPKKFDPNGDLPERDLTKANPDSWILLFPRREFVVVKGHHLRLSDVDRFGQFRVTTDDAEAAEAVGLEKESGTCWGGNLRREQIEARYYKKRMVKVQGHWLNVWGESSKSKSPAVRTEDAEVAAKLGLKPGVDLFPVDDEDLPRTPPRVDYWEGIVPLEQVEAEEWVKVDKWPIPEAKAQGSDGDQQG